MPFEGEADAFAELGRATKELQKERNAPPPANPEAAAQEAGSRATGAGAKGSRALDSVASAARETDTPRAPTPKSREADAFSSLDAAPRRPALDPAKVEQQMAAATAYAERTGNWPALKVLALSVLEKSQTTRDPQEKARIDKAVQTALSKIPS